MSKQVLIEELASLRLDDEPPRQRRVAWAVIALLVFMMATGTIFWLGRGVFAATEVETTTPRSSERHLEVDGAKGR